MSSTPEKKVQDAERAPEDISDSVVKLSVSEASRGRTARSETPMTNLAPFEWDTLERHYHEAMQERDEVEKKINLEFQSMVEVDFCFNRNSRYLTNFLTRYSVSGHKRALPMTVNAPRKGLPQLALLVIRNIGLINLKIANTHGLRPECGDEDVQEERAL